MGRSSCGWHPSIFPSSITRMLMLTHQIFNEKLHSKWQFLHAIRNVLSKWLKCHFWFWQETTVDTRENSMVNLKHKPDFVNKLEWRKMGIEFTKQTAKLMKCFKIWFCSDIAVLDLALSKFKDLKFWEKKWNIETICHIVTKNQEEERTSFLKSRWRT